MFNSSRFKNLDNEFKEILVNFVYDEISKKHQIEDKTMNLSYYLNEKFDDKNILNEEKYCEEITKYMQNESCFKDELIKKAKKLIEIDKEAQFNK